MNFASLQFWVIFLAGYGLFAIIRRFVSEESISGYDQLALFCLSFGLLCSESLLTGGVFLYVGLIGIVSVRNKLGSRVLGICAVILLITLPLVFFKYSHFLSSESGLFQGYAWAGLIPMGISFYTFQAIGMIVDYRKTGLEGVRTTHLFNFLSFFPQIVAGPIERTKDLLPQIQRFEFRIRSCHLEAALKWVVLGLFFKLVMADNFAVALATLKNDGRHAFEIWLRVLGLGFRIYFDFAGYSFIALGLAHLFGVKLTLNFRSPYLAESLQEFWRRWHITLSTWIRDYLYIPLGGSRTRYWAFAIVFVFVASGAWHGAGWNFLLWGAVHGIGLVVWKVFGKFIPSGFPGWLLTQMIVFVAWLPFFTVDFRECLDSFGLLFDLNSYSGASLDLVIRLFNSRGDFLMFGFLMLVSFIVIAAEYLSVKSDGNVYSMFQRRWVQYLLIVMIVVIGSTSEGDFVYFNF